jgi:uncharacterized coiled-coil DUF342 family protein
MATEQLEVSLVETLKELSAKKNELTLKAGQIHLEIKELTNISNKVDVEYLTTVAKLDELLTDLQSKYPNGEVDLLEGTVTF